MIKRIITVLAVLLLAQAAFSVSVTSEVVQQLKDSGQFDKFIEDNKKARDKGVWEPNDDPYQFGVTTDLDTLYCLILLVDFEDNQYQDGFNSTPDDFDSLLFSEDVFEPGSMTDYYFETSYGQAFLMGEVTQWLRMPELYSYYVDGQRGFGSYPRNAQRLTEDAVLAADPYVDFEPYDNDGDLMVDGLFVVHAGPGYEDTGNVNYIHSHAWVTRDNVWLDDDVYVRRYSMEPEETGSGQLVHIGVFCHEFGHVLGLPDLYDYDYDSDGTGMWSLMSAGSWGGGGITPVHFDAWCKFELGWVAPTILDENLDNEQIDAVEFSPDVYLLYSNGYPSNQYFLVENRRQQLFDVSVPGSGLLIYHVDENVDNNDDQDHYHVAIEQADGQFDLENNNGSDPGDPWPGTSNNTTFDDFSTPSAWYYYSGPSEVAVAEISESDSVMYADLYIEYNEPLYELLEVSFDDDGNEDGVPEAGETCDLLFTAQNIRIEVDNLEVIVSCSDPLIEFSDSISAFGPISVDTPFNNSGDPITFSVPSDYVDGYVEFSLSFNSQNGEFQQELLYPMLIGEPDLLLVDDDNGSDLESYYFDAFDNLGLLYIVWDVSIAGSPASVLNQYNMVVWFTGDTRTEAMTVANVEGLIDYLDNGGRLLVTSQDFIQLLSDRGQANDLLLINNYLKVDYVDREQNHTIVGVEGTGFDGLEGLTIGAGGAYNQISQDALAIQSGGIQLATYDPGTVAIVGVLTNYTAVTAGFGIEGLNNDLPNYSTREDFIEAAIQFLLFATDIEESSEPIPLSYQLGQNYPNPFNAQTTIEYYIPENSKVTLEMYDILGRNVEILIDGYQPAGIHNFTWDATDYPSGVYFYRLAADQFTETKRLVLLK